ncbi:hypothetical protein THRCLA_23330 [Thraustotheca clavata]|uniref:Uncharacterized protein n=1 Tax=Thraustotheca clavata TaxID=74557 RepID=A0A1V9Y7I9_9STRA|nr:hypothetical protein THRCLA_23330 [Thraustotheca clavata]
MTLLKSSSCRNLNQLMKLKNAEPKRKHMEKPPRHTNVPTYVQFTNKLGHLLKTDPFPVIPHPIQIRWAS